MARVFISYARKDGRALADRLASALEALSHEPWVDRSKIQGGRSWSREVEAAIDRSSVLLAILTNGSFVSDICRGEQMRALRKGKLVIPLLGEANPDRPVYLEADHYLDFSREGEFDRSMTELARAIDSESGVRVEQLPQKLRDQVAISRPLESMAAAFDTGSASWSDIVSMGAESMQQFLHAVAPRGSRPGVYDSELYVDRAAAGRELSRFVEGDRTALVLLGRSGVGKTNLLCHWMGDLAARGHAVFAFHGAKLTSPDLMAEIARSLHIEDPQDLLQTLRYIDGVAERENRRFLLVFDGINEFRSGDEDRQCDLVRELDLMICRLPGKNVRVALSCSSTTWARLDRAGDLNLSWGKYHLTANDEEFLVLDSFTEDEAERAYELYRERFGLPRPLSDLPAELRAQLQEPVMLRLFAETARAAPDATTDVRDEADIFRRYFTEHVRRREDLAFVEAMVAAMRAAERPRLSLHELASHPSLGDEVGSDDPDGPYRRLLDCGVLAEIEGKDPLFDDETVGFAYPMIGAYALARYELRGNERIDVMTRRLVELSEKLPFAWDAAEIVLVERAGDELFAELARAPDAELRELGIEALTSVARRAPDRVRRILQGLLDLDDPLASATALRAAYAIGPTTRGVFLQAALSGSDTLRQAARDTLYLIWMGTTRAGRGAVASDAYFLWRHSPDFTHELIRELVGRTSWLRPHQTYRIWRFVLDLLITIYINHCDRPDVAERTAETFHQLTVDRLHLDRVRLASRVERAALKIIGGVFSHRILRWVLADDEADEEAFFRRPPEERALLAALAPFLDPAASIDEAEPVVRGALTSSLEVHAACAALVLAVHAHSDFERADPVVRRLFESVDHWGRLWTLMGFSVIWPATPTAWTPLLEDLTSALLSDDADGSRRRPALLNRYDLFFVPLGLSYGKAGEGMPLYRKLLERGATDQERRARVIAGLGPVGFYYPRATLSTLAGAVDGIRSVPEERDALATALGTMRRLHVDLVDSFMLRTGVGEELRRRVVTGADTQRIDRFVHLLGYYNNAVHYCVSYPRMRRDLGMFTLQLLAEADSAREFIVEYSEQALRMARASRFNLLEWTLP